MSGIGRSVQVRVTTRAPAAQGARRAARRLLDAGRARVPRGTERVEAGALDHGLDDPLRGVTDVTDAVPAAQGARWYPATAASRMGGDLHAVRTSPYGLRLLIGDARGLGAAAGACAHAVLEAFGTAAATAPTLEALVDTLEAAVVRHASGLANGARDEEFATAVVAEVSPDGGTLRLVDRGNPAPLLLRPGSVRTLAPQEPGPPLGLGDLAPAGDWSLTVPFPADSTLVLMTDGTTEARDADGSFYDPVARLRPHSAADPESVVRTLRREVRAHVARRVGGRPADDMAVLALRAPALPTP